MSATNDKNYFPVTHSILSVNALIMQILTQYSLGTFVEGKLISRNMNDTYCVRTTTEKYILRVYRHNWRTVEDILYELDILLHLKNKGIKVSIPIENDSGSLINFVNAPEGERLAA